MEALPTLEIDPDYTAAFKHEIIPRWIRRLAEAILLQAINDLGKKNYKARQQAIAWLLSDDTSYVFSFLNCCEITGIHHTKIRSFYFRNAHTTADFSSQGIDPV